MKSNIAAKLGPFSRALHPKFGFTSGILATSTFSTTIRTFMLRTEEYYDYIRDVRVSSAGATRGTLSDCIGPSFGETFERYSLSVEPRLSQMVERSVEDFSREENFLNLQSLHQIQGLHPMQFSIFSNRFKRIEKTTKLNWFKARYLLDNSEVWVPTIATVLKMNEYIQVTTNACAIERNEISSMLKASYELMERDSFLKMWWRKESPVFLEFKEAFRKLDPILYRSFGPWIDLVHVAYIPNEFNIPILFCAFRSFNKDGHPALIISGGAHLNPEKALASALNEMASAINHKMVIYKDDEVQKYKNLVNYDQSINDFHDHTFYYMFDEFAEKAHFILQIDDKNSRKDFSEIVNLETGNLAKDLEVIKGAFKGAGFNPIVVDLTSNDVRSLGFSVVRMLDPKTIELNSMHCIRPWGKERLFCEKIRTIADLNQLPHPFP